MNDHGTDLELLGKILCDYIPNGVILDAVHGVGQTPHNQHSVITKLVKLVQAGETSYLTVAGPAGNGYPGGAVWEAELRQQLSQAAVTIEQVPYALRYGSKDLFSVNTYGEALAAVRLAYWKGWKSIGITAAPFHQLRAFMSFVTAAVREYPELKIYSLVGTPLNWDEEAVHSQGTLRATRSDLLKVELSKIIEYHAKGWLVSSGQALEYLQQRDSLPT